jgi:uncharacterized RDD family membrane protein YckC
MSATPFSGTTSTRARDFDFFGSLRRRFLASLAASVGWVSLTLLYVAFWAHNFSLFQSIVVVIVSLLLLTAFLVGAWVSFGMRFVGHWTD